MKFEKPQKGKLYRVYPKKTMKMLFINAFGTYTSDGRTFLAKIKDGDIVIFLEDTFAHRRSNWKKVVFGEQVGCVYGRLEKVEWEE